MLEDALADFSGTILAVSHDRYFINKLSDRILRINNKKLENYQGNYTYFLEKSSKITSDLKVTVERSVSSEKLDYQTQKKNAAEERKRKNRLEKIEKEISDTEETISKIDNELSLPEIVSDYIKCAELTEESEKLNEKLLSLYEEWESLQ